MYVPLLIEIEKKSSRIYSTTESLFYKYIKHPNCILEHSEKDCLLKIIQDFSNTGIKFE